MSERLLLDTHAALWWVAGEPISAESRARIEAACGESESVMVSPISAWEIAMSLQRGRVRLPRPPLDWYRDVVTLPGFGETALTADILVGAESLPGTVHGDPVDRFLIATARRHELILVTRDRNILDYGAAGHVMTLAC